MSFSCLEDIKTDLEEHSEKSSEQKLMEKITILPSATRTVLPQNFTGSEFETELQELCTVTKMRRDLLVYKNNSVAFWINMCQISVIFVSTFISFLETASSVIDRELQGTEKIIPVALSTYIGVVVALVKFNHLEECKEAVSQLISEKTNLLKRFHVVQARLNDLKKKIELQKLFKTDDTEPSLETHENFVQIVETYRTEIFASFLDVQEKFDIIMPYPDLIRFKKMFARKFLEHSVVEENIAKVEDFVNLKNSNITQKSKFVRRVTPCSKLLNKVTGFFCQKRSIDIDFEEFDFVEIIKKHSKEPELLKTPV